MTLPVTPGQKPDPQEPTTLPAAPVTPQVVPEEDELLKGIKADPIRAREEIKALRKEAADNRIKAQKAQEERDAAEKKKLEEQGEYKTLAEKQKQEIADLKASQRQEKINSAVALEAAKAHITNPAVALKLADLSKVDVSETGVVSGVAEAIAELIKAEPYLVQAAPDGKTQTTAPHINPTNPGGGPVLTQEGLRQMSAQDIAAMGKEELAAALSGKR